MQPAKGGGRAFTVLLALASGVGLTFLALPLVALFTQVPLRDVPSLLRDPAVRDAIAVTLRTNAIANVLIVAVGTPVGYLLATRRFRGRAIAVTLVELPLVLPPAVAGIGLLAAFGAGGPPRRAAQRRRDRPAVQPVGRRAGGDLRRLAVLRPPGDHVVRGRRPGARRRRAHARRDPGADVPADLAAARGERAARGLGARVRARR